MGVSCVFPRPITIAHRTPKNMSVGDRRDSHIYHNGITGVMAQSLLSGTSRPAPPSLSSPGGPLPDTRSAGRSTSSNSTARAQPLTLNPSTLIPNLYPYLILIQFLCFLCLNPTLIPNYAYALIRLSVFPSIRRLTTKKAWASLSSPLVVFHTRKWFLFFLIHPICIHCRCDLQEGGMRLCFFTTFSLRLPPFPLHLLH